MLEQSVQNNNEDINSEERNIQEREQEMFIMVGKTLKEL